MTTAAEIKETIVKFREYVKSLNTERLKQLFTIEELEQLSKDLRNMDEGEVSSEASLAAYQLKLQNQSDIVQELKHYPLINSIQILNEDQKVQLDQYLGRLESGHYYRTPRDFIVNQIDRVFLNKWLLANNIIEKTYQLLCPNCGSGHLSNSLSATERNELDESLKVLTSKEPTGFSKAKVEELLDLTCNECFNLSDYDEITEEDFVSYLVKK